MSNLLRVEYSSIDGWSGASAEGTLTIAVMHTITRRLSPDGALGCIAERGTHLTQWNPTISGKGGNVDVANDQVSFFGELSRS